MNTGRFFSLNQNLSQVVEGVVVYDYTPLSAYQGLAEDNVMSSKYPISLVITTDTVRFRMHYCAYKSKVKIKPDTHSQVDGKAEPGKSNVAKQEIKYDYQYQYAIEDVFKTGAENNIAHVDEIILELPFVENPTKDLTDIVKSAYIANFPQISDDPSQGTARTGSLYIDKLIRERFKEAPQKKCTGESEEGSETGFENKPTAVSYSTLWLMDLYKDNRFYLYDDNPSDTEGNKLVTKFLRKLLLDFMFDLKHSSVFCTSPNYGRMYSGLMSNYYFSALMHKCEFYYYRELTIQAIEEEEKKDKKIKLDYQITRLYAQELFDAEEKWAADIRNPLADKYFEQKFPDDFQHRKWLNGREWTEFCSNVVERMTTTRWDSWFANPEEEMRRIYFVMNEEKGIKRICNSIVLAEHLMMDKSEDDTVKAMALSARQNRGNTSRWFLNRYDFNDVLHLHLFKWSNIVLVILAVVTLFILFEPPIPFVKEQPALGLDCLLNIITAISEWFIDHYILYSLVGLTCFILFINWGNLYPDKGSVLLKSFRRFRAKRIVLIIWAGVCLLLLPFVMFEATNYRNWLLPLVVIISFIYCAVQFINKPKLRCLVIALPIVFFAILYSLKVLEFEDNWRGVPILLILLTLAGVYYWIDSSRNLGVFRKPYIHPIESWHVLLPKLVASITTAWLTIAMGFDALAAFFDSAVVWSTMTIIIIVVFSFILYQIDRELPESSSWLKICRTSEMLIISYCLSLCIGVIILNFVGERYLARSGAVGDYYNEYVYEYGQAPVIMSYESNDSLIAIPALEFSKEKIDLLGHNYTKLHWTQDTFYLDTKKPVFASKVIPLSKHNKQERSVFVIPDFLVMFSFVAMFIGVFLQMVFFDRKKMTEF